MISRYQTQEMALIWEDKTKLGKWLEVELAVLVAKAQIGLIPQEIVDSIGKHAFHFCHKRVAEIESEVQHDLLAFVQAVQEQLEEHTRKYFHADLTSYDVEEPASSLMIIAATKLILDDLRKLVNNVKEKALMFKHLPAIGRTHGQHAEPITFGLRFLVWYDALMRQQKFIRFALDEIYYSKISGAVGTYSGMLSPELEERALDLLGLKPAKVTGQIILRDRHVHLLNALATLAAVLENIAENIRILGQTEIGEVKEPFGKSQKGSSRMPHKENTDKTENVCGLAAVARHNAGAILEKVVTWGERDISHSSVERIVIPDTFHLVHFMLRRMNGVIKELRVNETGILKNLWLTKGVIFSPEVKELLMNEGVDPEEAYRICQTAAFEALEKDRHYLGVLLENDAVPESIKHGKLQNLFDMETKLRHINAIYARCGL